MCLPSYVFVEWHLDALSDDEVLAGMGLRVGLESMVRAACGNASAPVIEHEDHLGNNNWGRLPNALARFAAAAKQSRRGDGS